jgi:two-component system, OmpR family, phosphate regulon response regulator PhoB
MTAAILVCEDDPTHRELIRASLARTDYRIFEIEDGRHLLEAAKSTRPDVIILDRRLPATDGVEQLAELRADPIVGGVAVLMLSGAVRPVDREAAYAAGADEFLAKPFSPRELAKTVASMVAVRHAGVRERDAA